MKKFLLFLLVLVTLSMVAFFAVPWNTVLEKRVRHMLTVQGIETSALTIEKISFNEAIISNITLDQNTNFSLRHAALTYSLRELIDGSLHEVILTGLSLELRQTAEGWGVSGWPQHERPADEPFVLDALLQAVPFSKLTIADSTLTIAGNSLQASFPFSLTYTRTPSPVLTLDLQETVLTAANQAIPFGPFHAEITPADKENWSGVWTLAMLDISNITPVPALAGKGTIDLEATALSMKGNLLSADQEYKGDFSLIYDSGDKKANALTVAAASFPFKEGRIATRNLVIPLHGTTPIQVNLQVQKVSVDAMLQTLTGKRVTATGTLSGSVPLIINKDGSYRLGRGSLKADGAGSIQMQEDAIPGNNEQVALVRDILQNLQYNLLSASVENANAHDMTVRLSIEGRNPAVMDGRTVKLNINLTGDVLDFIQQNIMLITNPEKLLEQKRP